MIPTRYISAGPLGAKASNAPAQAQAQAGEAIGNAISQVGETGMEIVGKIRKVKDAGISAAFMAQAEEEADRFALALAKRSDTDAWPQDWKNKADSLKQLAQNQALSAEGKASLNADLVGWHSKKAIAFETQALSKELALGHARTTQTLAYHTGRLDKDSFDRDLKHAVKAGIYNPAEAEAAQMHFQGVEADMDMQRMVEGNPQGVIDQPSENFLKRLPGATMEMVEQAKRQAKGVVKERAFDTLESAQDEIYSGKVTTPQMIDENPRYAALRPTVRERLKKNLKDFQYEKAQGLMNTPEAQAAVVGKVSSMLSGWEPKAEEDADLKYAAIQGQIGRLPDGSMKTELERQAKAIRHGSWADSTSHADAAMKSLDAAAKAGRFGVVPEVAKIPTARLVKDGFLKDTAKLQRLGFSEDQAGQIVGAASEGSAKGQGLLSELWSKRDSGNVKGSEFEIATGNALRLGHATVTGWDDPESEDAAISAKIASEKNLGESKMKLTEFMRINPKATPDQIDGKILDMAGEQTVRELKSGIYDGKRSTSGGPAGASDSTASLPVGSNLTEIVKNFEASSGFHSKAYWDYGQWSIGYGTKAKEGETITQTQADERLASELGSHRARVETAAGKTGLKFTATELDALTSFDYNTGKVETLLANGTRSKQQIADTMLLYRNAGGERLRGLENRRKAERHLFLYGHNA